MFDEIDQSEGIQPGEILFVNWESVNKESNVMVRENESFASLYKIIKTSCNLCEHMLQFHIVKALCLTWMDSRVAKGDRL